MLLLLLISIKTTWANSLSINGSDVKLNDTLSLLPYFEIENADQTKEDRILIRDKAERIVTLNIQNLDNTPANLVLFLGYEHKARIIGIGEEKLIGTLVPYQKKKGNLKPGLFLRNEGFSGQVKLTLQPHEQKEIQIIFKRIINKPLPLNISIYKEAFFNQLTAPKFRHFGQGLFQGIVWALILYHLIFFVLVKDRTYLYYCGYMVCISFMTLGDFGYWYDFFRNAPYLGWGIYLILQYFTGIMTLVFMQSFVRLKTLLPKWNKYVTYFIWANIAYLLLLIIIYIITEDYYLVHITRYLIVPFTIIGVFFCYKLLKTKDVVAIIFAIAGGVLAIAVLINGILEFKAVDRVNSPYLRFYIMQVAAVLHLLTFSIGIGFRQRNKDLETHKVKELSQIKNRFYTNITHEFRTPLTVIMGVNEQITGNAEKKEIINRNSNNLLQLINQLLELSKLESDQIELNYEQGNIVAFLQFVTESFRSLAIDKNIRLTFYNELDEIMMDYDKVRVQAIINNLLSNAIKFTNEGGKNYCTCQSGKTKTRFIFKTKGKRQWNRN